MKRAKSKFYKKLQTGGLTFGQSSILGTGIDLLGNTLARKTAEKPLGQGNEFSTDALGEYNKIVEKNKSTSQNIGTGLSAAGSVAMMFPGYGTAIGLGLKGLGAISKMINFGAGKERDALRRFKNMERSGNQLLAARQGAVDRNTNYPEYEAPAYGKKGLKFKTKFSRT